MQDAAAAVHLYAVENTVSSAGLAIRHNRVDEAAGSIAAAEIRRRRDPVRLDDVQPHRVRVQRCSWIPLDENKDIAGHEPRFQGKLLQGFKIIQPERVAVLLFAAP